MLKEEIVVGKSYVNEDRRTIREVVEEVDGHYIRYNAFDLKTGRLIDAPLRLCHRREMARWADRETASSEIARVHPYEKSAWLDEPFASAHGTLNVEQARAAIDGVPGTHVLPRVR